jgi:hypothetical protein
MEKEDIDHVRRERQERPIDTPNDRRMRPVVHMLRAVAPLGSEHEFVAAMLEMTPDALLGKPIRARRIDQRDASVERS